MCLWNSTLLQIIPLLEVHVSFRLSHSPYSEHVLGFECQQLLIQQIELQQDNLQGSLNYI